MKTNYDFERVDKKEIDKALVDALPKEMKKTTENLASVYANKYSGKIKKGKEYDLVGQMPKKMQKRYFDAIKNK